MHLPLSQGGAVRNGGGNMRASHLRHEAVRLGKTGSVEFGSPPKVHVHSATAYRSGARDCDECRRLHAERENDRRAQRRAGLPGAAELKAKRDALALMFLEDGCSYREAATSARVDEKRLAREHPEFHENQKIWKAVLTQIKNDARLLEMHRIIWQGAEYGQS